MPGSRRSALRAWIPAVISLLVQLGTTGATLATAGRGGSRFGVLGEGHRPPLSPLPVTPTHPLAAWVAGVLVVLAIVGPALLAFIGRRPPALLTAITALAVTGTVICAAQGTGAPFYLSVLFGAAATVFLRHRVWAWCCAGAYWLAFASAYLATENLLQLGWLVPLTLLSIAALLGPEFGRARRDARLRAVRETEARRLEEAQAERVRIARELHDVLAHSLSQINVQASVGLHLFDAQPDKAADALASIKDASKQALGEVRQVLGMLRGDDAPLAPEHGLSDLEGLLGDLRAQGVETTLRVEVADSSPLPTAVQQAAYRIVQEALTNVTRHAHAAHVQVAVTATGDRVRVMVRDDGTGGASSPPSDRSGATPRREGPTTSPSAAGGRGLLGMRERAELLGGSFSAGPRREGGFEVVAELPVRAS